MPLTTAQAAAYQRIINPGSSAQAVRLPEAHIRALIYIAAQDIGLSGLPQPDAEIPNLFDDRFDFDLDLPGTPAKSLFEQALTLNPEMETYISCLAAIHKFRMKYRRVVSTQAFPTMEQVGPRALLQYKQLGNRSLAALLIWRKWLFDVDNRAAQDTGYLFEPVITSAVGGVSYGAKSSPIRRLSDSSKGRQVDCIKDQRAYELKIRVTIAASGQGRWSEELSFPAEARAAGYTPVILVLDPTDNKKLSELVRAYEEAGGESYLGETAWAHLKAEASPEMSVFLENYIRTPLDSVVDAIGEEDPLPTFAISDLGGAIRFSIGDDSWEIAHRPAHGQE